jgi:hypothetical protein
MNSSADRKYGRDDVDFDTWYSPWMKQLASTKSREDLVRLRFGAKREAASAARSHLRAVEATHSMTGASARRAHSRNVVAAAGDYAIALDGALEIHDLFPEHALRPAR